MLLVNSKKVFTCVLECVCVSRQSFNVLTHIGTLQIQEEMEMWKMRDLENQMSDHKHLSDTESVR